MSPTRREALMLLFLNSIILTVTITDCGRQQERSLNLSQMLLSIASSIVGSNNTIDRKPTSVLVIGGTESTLGSWPWQALIVYTDSNDGNTYMCGGSLISPIHVMTAAHCAVPMAIATSYVKMGTISSDLQSTKGVIRKVVAKYVHPRFTLDEKLNPAAHFDIAVIQLNRKVQYTRNIQPICLPSNDTDLVKNYGTVTGWGKYTIGNQPSPGMSVILRQAYVPFINRQRCSDLWMKIPSAGFPIVDSQLCAGAWNKGTGEGDSGGPLQVLHKGVWYQVGITSFGENTPEGLIDQGSYPGVFTRVSSYCDFIRDATKALVRCSSNAVSTTPQTFLLSLFVLSITYALKLL